MSFSKILYIISALAVVAGGLVTAGVLPGVVGVVAAAVAAGAGALAKSPIDHP